MGKNSKISWCDHTFNLWWGCVEVSPACDNCYARELDKRFGGDHWGTDKPRKFFGDKHWNELLRWNRAAVSKCTNDLVFVQSMGDLLEKREDLEPYRQRFWDLVRKTSALTYLLLSKRPQFFEKMIPQDLVGDPRLWLGTTIESPAYLWRADALNKNRHAAVRFASMEPLIEKTSIASQLVTSTQIGINWVIAGCESGAKARPCEVDWLSSLRDQCTKADVPFFLKQAKETQLGICGDNDNPNGKKPCGKPVTAYVLSPNTAVYSCGCTTEGGEDGVCVPVGAGSGSTCKPGGIIDLPYLDGVQWAQRPEVPR